MTIAESQVCPEDFSETNKMKISRCDFNEFEIKFEARITFLNNQLPLYYKCKDKIISKFSKNFNCF